LVVLLDRVGDLNRRDSEPTTAANFAKPSPSSATPISFCSIRFRPGG
jgi:hypothetical protein